MIPVAGPEAIARPGGGWLSLAGLSVLLDGRVCPSFSLWPDSYRPFLFSDSKGENHSHFRMGKESLHPRDELFVSSYVAGSWQVGRYDEREVYRFHASENHPYLWAEPNSDFSEVDIWIDSEGGRQMPPLLHPVDRVLCMGVLANRGGFIVHSCGWACNGKSVLFPGVSGAGKTTLCRQLMAAGQGNVLSDDRVVLREGPEGFRACGTPWPGDAKQARNESAPLAVLCFIEQSPEHRLIPIRPAEALRRLMEAASIPWFSPKLRDLVLPQVERLVSTVPAYRLGFRPDPGVMDVVRPLVTSAE